MTRLEDQSVLPTTAVRVCVCVRECVCSSIDVCLHPYISSTHLLLHIVSQYDHHAHTYTHTHTGLIHTTSPGCFRGEACTFAHVSLSETPGAEHALAILASEATRTRERNSPHTHTQTLAARGSAGGEGEGEGESKSRNSSSRSCTYTYVYIQKYR